MGKCNRISKPFQTRKKKPWNKNKSKLFENARKEKLVEYNKNTSWFDQEEERWNTEINASRRKIVIPEEDIYFDDDDDDDDDDGDDDYDDENVDNEYDNTYIGTSPKIMKLDRHLIVDVSTLENGINNVLSCKFCNGSVSLFEDTNHHQGLGTNWLIKCSNKHCKAECTFPSTKKYEAKNSYQINTVAALGMRAIEKVEVLHQNYFRFSILVNPSVNLHGQK